MNEYAIRFLLRHPRFFRATASLLSRLVPDPQKQLVLVQWLGFQRGGRASACLEHYLQGTGAPREFDISNLLQEDDGVQQHLAQEIAVQNAQGLTSGQVAVPQFIFSSLDWRCALGSVNFKWKQEGANLVIWFEEPYRWAPLGSRITQVFHRAAEQMKHCGAREFILQGRPANVGLQELCRAAAGLHVPIDRFYL